MTSAHSSLDTRVFYKECVSLAKAGYDTYLVAQGNSFDRDGVHILGVGETPHSRLERMIKTAKKVYQVALALDAQIYHIHDPELLPYGLKLKRKGKKVIFDSHENTLAQMDEKEWIPAVIRPLVSRLYCVYATHVFRKCDAIISVTPHICEPLKRYNSRVCMVTNYPLLRPMSTEIGVKQDDFLHICFAGGVSTQWSHEYILKALAQVPECRYSVWGEISADYQAELQTIPGYAQTIFFGQIAHEQVEHELANQDAGMAICQYSQNSGGELGTLGNTKIFEYMAVQLPLICTNFTLWQEIVDKYHCGICVDPADSDSIASAITYLRDHPDEAHQMGINGRKAVEQEFNWGTQETKLIELYQTLSAK